VCDSATWPALSHTARCPAAARTIGQVRASDSASAAQEVAAANAGFVRGSVGGQFDALGLRRPGRARVRRRGARAGTWRRVSHCCAGGGRLRAASHLVRQGERRSVKSSTWRSCGSAPVPSLSYVPALLQKYRIGGPRGSARLLIWSRPNAH
jgi:hypothetical protein